MLKRLLISITGFVFSTIISAQNPDEDCILLKFRQWDSFGNHDSIIEFSNRYNTIEIESYYVQHVVGKAFFQKQNYRRAIVYLEKATEYYRHSSENNVMLYYAYLYSGNEVMAKYQSSTIPKEIKKKEGIISFRGIEKIYFELGKSISNNIENNGAVDYSIDEPISINNNQFALIDDYSFFHGGVQFSVSPSISTFISFHQFQIDEKIHQIIVPGLIYKDHYYQSREDDGYANLTFRIGKKWSLSPAYHWQKYTSKREVFENGLPILKDSVFISQLYSMQLKKNTLFSAHHFTLGYSSINLSKQWHIDYDYYHFPKGNLNFYTSWNFGLIAEKSVIEPHIRFLTGKRITPWWWFEMYLGIGNLRNGSEDNGYLLYNYNDNSLATSGLNFIFPITHHLEVRIMYQYWLKSVIYPSDEKNTGRGQQKSSLNKFNNHNFSGGILWKL